MKYIYVFFIIFVCTTFVMAQEHSPLCQDIYQSIHVAQDTAECYGYAMARAFGKSYNDPVCPANSHDGDAISLKYFYHVNTVVYDNNIDYRKIELYDVLEFGDHAAYVVQVPTNYSWNPRQNNNSGIYVDHKENPGTPAESLHVALSVVEQKDGAIFFIDRMRKEWKIQVKNSFNLGQIEVNDTLRASGWTEENLAWDESVKLMAYEADRMRNGFYKRLTTWLYQGNNQNNSNKTIYARVKGIISATPEWTAKLEDEYHLRFENNFSGLSDKGTMQIGGTVYNGISFARVFNVLQEHSLQASAINGQVFNHIVYGFDHWEDNNTVKDRTFSPNGHEDHTAYYTGIPEQVQNVYENGTVGQPVHLIWDRHPNVNCKYKIYRKVKQYGDSSEFLTTLNNDVTSYTDYLYKKTAGYSDLLLHYDVRAFYTTENSEADPNWLAVFGSVLFKGGPQKNPPPQKYPVDYALSNYPNPFNPSTTILFKLPKAATINISIFNENGKKIKTIVNGYREAGRYAQNWNGDNRSGQRVVSGLYFVRFSAPGMVMTHKLLLMK